MELLCKRCGHWNSNAPTGAGQPACPACGALLWRKKRDAPALATHAGMLAGAVFGVGGLLVLLLYAGLQAAPLGRLRLFGSLLLYITAVKVAWSVMNTQGGRIKFPQLDPREFFDTNFVPLVVYVLVFVTVPMVMLGVAWDKDPLGWRSEAQARHEAQHYEKMQKEAEADAEKRRKEMEEKAARWQPSEEAGEDGEGGGWDRLSEAEQEALEKRWEENERRDDQAAYAARAAAYRETKGKVRMLRAGMTTAAVLLGLYAAMALVLFLRSNSALGMLDVPSALTILRADPKGYLVLAIVILLINALSAAARGAAESSSLALSLPLTLINGVGTLYAYGLAGLYARQNARLLNIPCDDDDWEPMAEPAADPGRPQRTATRAPAAAPPAGGPAAPSAVPGPAATTSAAVPVRVFNARLAGRPPDGAGVLVQDSTGRTSTVAPGAARAVAAAVLAVPDAAGAMRYTLVVDLLMDSQPTSRVVLRLQSDTGNAGSLFPGTPDPEAWRSFIAEMLGPSTPAWPDRAALANAQYPQFPGLAEFERALYQVTSTG